MKTGTVTAATLLAFVLLAPAASLAEPYLAVRTGYKCIVCHVNPTGGGKRAEFGSIYSQTAMAAERLDLRTGKAIPAGGSEPESWTGRLNDQFAVGADLRANSQYVAVPHDTDTFAFTPRAQAYLEVKPIADRLTIYVDERVSPGAATNRETYALLWFANRSAYVKAGRMFVPFGLRIEDDTAFIRQGTGTNFNSSDDGVEGGLELGPWSAQVSVTNGAGGGTETNRGKLISSLFAFVQPVWRVGISASTNSNGAADRRMQSVFAGLRTPQAHLRVLRSQCRSEGGPARALQRGVGIRAVPVHAVPPRRAQEQRHSPEQRAERDRAIPAVARVLLGRQPHGPR